MKKLNRLISCTIALVMAMGFSVSAQGITVDFISSDQWGQPDEVLGLAGGTVEDFEDTQLAAGLAIEIADSEGNFTGIGVTTLPNVFDPINNDPYGDSFVAGIWDGSHCLVNTQDNQSQYYGSPDWNPVAFYIPEGTAWIGIATQQVTNNHGLVVNGQIVGRLAALGFDLDPGPNGMMIIRADDPEELIESVSFGGGGDAFTVDHVVFAPAGSLSSSGVNWDEIKAWYK